MLKWHSVILGQAPSELPSINMSCMYVISHGLTTFKLSMVLKYHYVQTLEGCNFRGLPKSRILRFYFRGSLVITPCTSSVLQLFYKFSRIYISWMTNYPQKQ